MQACATAKALAPCKAGKEGFSLLCWSCTRLSLDGVAYPPSHFVHLPRPVAQRQPARVAVAEAQHAAPGAQLQQVRLQLQQVVQGLVGPAVGRDLRGYYFAGVSGCGGVGGWAVVLERGGWGVAQQLHGSATLLMSGQLPCKSSKVPSCRCPPARICPAWHTAKKHSTA